MRQQTFTAASETELSEQLETLSTSTDYAQARSRLLVIFEPSCDREHLAQEASLASQALPDAHVVGMTTLGAPIGGIEVPQETSCSLMTFEESEVHVFAYDCHGTTPLEAGKRFVASLDGLADAKGVLFLSSCVQLWPAPFIDAIAKAHPELPVFGAQAGTTRIVNDQSLVLADGQVLDRGIVAVVLCGQNLHVRNDYNMGFRPIGREFQVTRSKTVGYVDDIDEHPAISVYRHYLGVEPDDHFFENVCSFPFLAASEHMLIPRVPLDCTPDGRLRFSMELPRDTRITLSYSKPEYLLAETLESANGMAEFDPQALLLFACVNRRVFMGDERADREFSYYAQVAPGLCRAYGYGEILRTSEGGGILNSTLIATGLREGSPAVAELRPIVDPGLEPEPNVAIPLSDRLVTFLEAITSELHGTIDGLAVLAERDQLTGLYNRRRMDELLSYEISRLKQNQSFGLLMLDIDHFKNINDTYGHETGDVVLQEVTRCIAEVVRAHDVLSRWGGEEFLCMATGASLEQATGLAERIRRHVERHVFADVGHVTVSIGVTSASITDSTRSLFNRADAALYEAKNSGRNRVCTS